MVRVKFLIKKGRFLHGAVPHCAGLENVCFTDDPACREYDWLVVYDEMPAVVENGVSETEELACPRERTILVTGEPPSIKLYPKCYTSQFGYVLTTHTPADLPHPNHIYGEGCLRWCAGLSNEEAFAMLDYPKSRNLATICSAKQQTHTLHSRRYALIKYLADKIPDMDWYGYGVKHLEKKYTAQQEYRYSLAIENYVAPYHWTDKISDPLLNLCLTFYVGDPRLEEIFPAESFIRIPLEDHEAAYRIIRDAIANNEYEKRLPAIREARRRLIERYNIFRRVAELIEREQEKTSSVAMPARPYVLKGRHRLRRNIFNLIEEGWEISKYKLARKLGLKP